MDISNLSAAQLRKAADLTEKIETLNAELSELLGSDSTIKAGKRGPKKGGMSAAGRAKIAAAQKARWAKFHAKTEPAKAEKPAKRKMSAAGRAAIVKAQKARWAKIKAKKG
jgi:hypothetical protein